MGKGKAVLAVVVMYQEVAGGRAGGCQGAGVGKVGRCR